MASFAPTEERLDPSADDAEKPADQTAIDHPLAFRTAIGLSLQLAWVPIAVHGFNVGWTAMPMTALGPVLVFLACATAACFVLCMLSRRISSTGSIVPGARFACAILGSVGCALAILWQGEGIQSTLLWIVAAALLGSSMGVSTILWSQSLKGIGSTIATIGVIACSAVFGLAFGLCSHITPLVADLITLGAIITSAVLWQAQEQMDFSSPKSSKLLTQELRSLLTRYAASFFALGVGSALLVGMFMSGLATPAQIPVQNYAILGSFILLALLGLGWLKGHEIDCMESYSLLFLAALVTFFPINPGSQMNQNLSLVMGESWIILLFAFGMLIAREVDLLCHQTGGRSLGIGPTMMFGGLAVGSILAYLVMNYLWVPGILDTSPARIEFITTCGLLMMATVYICTNTALNRELLRHVALTAMGRVPSSLPIEELVFPEGTTSNGATGNETNRDSNGKSSPIGIANRCRTITLDYGLTPREYEVLVVLAQGNSLAKVQSELVISEGTAITHRRNIYAKLGVHSKQELLDLVSSGEHHGPEDGPHPWN